MNNEPVKVKTPIETKIREVNKVLLVGEPTNITYDSFGGYTGYKPQYIIDSMNKVFGIGEWGFHEKNMEIVQMEKSQLAVANIEVFIKGIEYMPTAYGQSIVTRGAVGDAKKGAQTDAIKKGLSYFSIGNRAFHGLLPKPNRQATSNFPND
jgi:hypothetical protein